MAFQVNTAQSHGNDLTVTGNDALGEIRFVLKFSGAQQKSAFE
jgi:hypothetical protein